MKRWAMSSCAIRCAPPRTPRPGVPPNADPSLVNADPSLVRAGSREITDGSSDLKSGMKSRHRDLALTARRNQCQCERTECPDGQHNKILRQTHMAAGNRFTETVDGIGHGQQDVHC